MNESAAKILLIQAQNKDPYDKILGKLLSGATTVAKAIEIIKEEKRVKELQLLRYWKAYHQQNKEYRKREYRKKNPFKSKAHELQGSNRDTFAITNPQNNIRKITITKVGKI